jgi:hypothetical protein
MDWWHEEFGYGSNEVYKEIDTKQVTPWHFLSDDIRPDGILAVSMR